PALPAEVPVTIVGPAPAARPPAPQAPPQTVPARVVAPTPAAARRADWRMFLAGLCAAGVAALLVMRSPVREPAAPQLPKAEGTPAAPPSDRQPPGPAAREMTTEEIVARCEKGVALIQGPQGSGTGFLVRPGVLVTNYHVIRDAPLGRLKVY